MSSCRTWLGGLGVLAALLSLPQVARAESPGSKVTPVYVLAVDSEDADDQADALTLALRSHVKRMAGFSLLETSQSLGTLLVALKCPPKPDAPCLDRIADQLHADHFVWGQMNRKAGRVSVDLHLWSRGKPDAAASEQYADTATDPNDPTIVAAAEHAFAQLAHLPLADSHAARDATASGHGKDRSDRDETGGKDRRGALPAARESNSGSGGTVRAILGYTAIGLGAVGIGIGIYEGTRFYGARNDLDTARLAVPASVSNVCESGVVSAQVACNDYHKAANIRAEEFVALGVGGALAITGAILLALPASHDEKVPQNSGGGVAFSVAPMVGLHGTAGALLSGSF